MIRKLTLIAMAAALVLPVTTAWATSCHSDAKAQEPRCDVDRTCENLDNGIRCTIKAKGETTEAQVRECVRRCHGAASPAEGVTVEITDIAGGVVVTTTASDAEMVNHLQEHGGVCAKAGAGHHAEGHKCAGHQAEGHKCAGHGEDHASAGDQAEGHKCAGHGDDKPAEPKGCPHATGAGAEAPTPAPQPQAGG